MIFIISWTYLRIVVDNPVICHKEEPSGHQYIMWCMIRARSKSAILCRQFSNALLSKKTFVFCFKFRRSLCLRLKIIQNQHQSNGGGGFQHKDITDTILFAMTIFHKYVIGSLKYALLRNYFSTYVCFALHIHITCSYTTTYRRSRNVPTNCSECIVILRFFVRICICDR